MGFAGGKEGSKGFVKKVASTFSFLKKKNTTSDPKPLLSRSKSASESTRLLQGKKPLSDVKRTKSTDVLSQPRREKIDGSWKEFMKLRCFDDSDSIWCSSDCMSVTYLLEEPRLSTSFHFSVDEKIISWLSNVATCSLSLNQEATKENHHHQTSSKNIPKDGKVCNSARKSVGSGSAKLSENNKKTSPRRSCEGSSSSNKSVNSDLSLQSPEEKKVSFSLESEVSLSPIKTTVRPSGPTKTTPASTLEKVAEILDSESKIDVEPIFWPFEQKFDWTPEDISKNFSMSPRGKKPLRSKSAGTSPRSMRTRFQTKKLDLKEGCQRKLTFNSPGSNSKPTRIPEVKQTISKNQQPMRNTVKRNISLPSMLRKTSKTSSKLVPTEATEETKETLKGHKTAKKLIMTRKSRTFLEDDFALMNDFSIEMAVGLSEFKGREGIDSDFNTDSFLFDDCL